MGYLDKQCKGCNAIDTCGADIYHKEDGKCPCANCLIKMICQDVCLDYNNYVYHENHEQQTIGDIQK